MNKQRIAGKIRFKLSVLASMLPIFSAFPAYAEDQQVNSDQQHALPTITYTAEPLNKVSEVNVGAFGSKDFLEVPIAIQSYDAEDIKDRAARTVYDVLQNDASISNASYGNSFDNFRLRGFAMDNFNTIRRDGLTLAAHHDYGLENIERIDVLKGPSGFLYGLNSPGGTVNYIIKRPTKDPFTQITLQGSSLEQRYIAIDDSHSTQDGRFGYRFNAAYDKRGNFDHASDLSRKFIGLATDFRLNDRALLQLNFDWSEKSVIADPLLVADQSGRTNPNDPSTYLLPPKIDRRDLLTGSWFRHKTEAFNTDAKFQFDLSDNWKSITQANYSRVERNGGYQDLKNIKQNGDIGQAAYSVSRGEIFTAYSLQSYLAGKIETGVLQHDLFFGAAYKRHGDKSPFWDDVGGEGTNPYDYSVGNILRPVQPPFYDFGPKKPQDFNSKITETSIFSSDLVSINEYLQVLLGGRYVWYRSKNQSATDIPQSENTFVPAASLMFRPITNILTYVSYSKGFERGGNAPFSANNANQPMGTIKSEQYEIGLKTKLTDRLNLGFAAFDIRRDANYLNLSNDYVKDGEYKHRGVELELTGKVMNDLTLLANLAYLDTELNKVTDLSTLGKRSEGTPKWKGYLNANYRLPVLPELSIDAAYSYVSNRAVNAQNDGFIPSYSLIDAGLKYDANIQKTPVTFRLLGKNLFNKYYYSSAVDSGLAIGQPREVVFSAEVKF